MFFLAFHCTAARDEQNEWKFHFEYKMKSIELFFYLIYQIRCTYTHAQSNDSKNQQIIHISIYSSTKFRCTRPHGSALQCSSSSYEIAALLNWFLSSLRYIHKMCIKMSSIPFINRLFNKSILWTESFFSFYMNREVKFCTKKDISMLIIIFLHVFTRTTASIGQALKYY